MDEYYQIIDIRWKKIKDKYQEIMVLLDSSVKDLKEIPLKNYKFNYKFSKKRYCPGFVNKDGFQKCENNKVLEDYKYERCYECESKLGFRDAFLYGKEPNDNIREYMQKDHFVYLAYFTDGTVKVGTANKDKGERRLIEQDAFVYAFIAKDRGFDIQNVEKHISLKFGITEFVRSNQKKKWLGLMPDYNKAKQVLDSYINRIHDNISDDFKELLFSKDKIEVINILDKVDVFFPKDDPYFIKEYEYLVGEFSGLRGKFLLFENNSELIGLDMRNILGRRIIGYLDEYIYKDGGNLTLF